MIHGAAEDSLPLLPPFPPLPPPTFRSSENRAWKWKGKLCWVVPPWLRGENVVARPLTCRTLFSRVQWRCPGRSLFFSSFSSPPPHPVNRSKSTGASSNQRPAVVFRCLRYFCSLGRPRFASRPFAVRQKASGDPPSNLDTHARSAKNDRSPESSAPFSPFFFPVPSSSPA